MTLDELIEMLTDLREHDDVPGDTPVYFTYNYGDYWKTQVAGEVGEVELGCVEYSSYHNMFKVAEDETDKKAVLLSK